MMEVDAHFGSGKKRHEVLEGLKNKEKKDHARVLQAIDNKQKKKWGGEAEAGKGVKNI
jgi:hypothetical protein